MVRRKMLENDKMELEYEIFVPKAASEFRFTLHND